MRRDQGFTLIELLVAMTIMAVLLGLSAAPLRTFWLTQSLEGAADGMVTQLRKQQEDSVSQAFPRVFGARFVEGSADWTLVRYDPAAAPGNPVCSFEPRSFAPDGVFSGKIVIKAVTLTTDPSGKAEFAACASAGDKVIFFYPRGTSTGGSITLEQPSLGREEIVTVGVATGRVDRT